jgi:hypothetical protein
MPAPAGRAAYYNDAARIRRLAAAGLTQEQLHEEDPHGNLVGAGRLAGCSGRQGLGWLGRTAARTQACVPLA